jgi:antitoxin component of MazEF toxin-antitoxin module
MTRVVVGQCGRSLGVRVPADVARASGLEVGTEVDVVATDGGIVLKPTGKLTLDDLFCGKSDAEWRALYRGSEVDWGPDVGREVIEERRTSLCSARAISSGPRSSRPKVASRAVDVPRS